MEIKSLSRKTDLIFSKFSGRFINKEHYALIQTPDNPGFHWGNYIIFQKAPVSGDLKRWKALFDSSFPYYDKPNHYVFTWEEPSSGSYKEFLDAGFEFDEGVVLSTSDPVKTQNHNANVVVRKLQSDQDWGYALHNQVRCADPKYKDCNYEGFKREQMTQYRKMTDQGMGNWFGAFLGDQLVGDLGIFYEEDIARYQNVGTDPESRRKGVCQTLVYETARIALADYGVTTLVMEADAAGHAAKIYQSVGFKPTEKNYALSWWKKHS